MTSWFRDRAELNSAVFEESTFLAFCQNYFFFLTKGHKKMSNSIDLNCDRLAILLTVNSTFQGFY
ncbi:MAG: hypothetical protein ACFBSE_01205 [Prochloraceae cyanobacterium]